jgi:hypothetical protein
MFRTLFGGVCVLSLLVGSAAAVATVHSHRASHEVIWRTDAAAEAEGAHPSLAAVWREFREHGKPPGMRNGRRARAVVVQAFQPAAMLQAGRPAPQTPVARQYASLVLAEGMVEFRRYPQPPCRVPI